MMDTNLHLGRHPDVLSTELDETLLLMSVETGNYYEFDDIASAIWRELAEPKTVGELRDRLCERYEVSPEQCLQDIAPFLEKLRENKLIDIRTVVE